MKWYVATSMNNIPAAQEAMATLRAAGHEITHDWTQTDINHDPANRTKLAKVCAVADRHGVMNADCLLLLNFPGIRAAFTELGIAYGHCLYIFVIDAFKEGCPENLFFYDEKHVTLVESTEDAIRYTETNAGRYA